MGGHGVRLKLSVAESLRDKSGRRTAAVQDASRDLAPRKFRQVLDCGCPSAAFATADLGTDTFNRTRAINAQKGQAFKSLPFLLAGSTSYQVWREAITFQSLDDWSVR